MDIQVMASGSKGNCYRINDGETALLIEAGVSLKTIQRACRFHLSDISGCLISHSHQDHCQSHSHLAAFGMDIYLAKDTLAEIKGKGHRYHALEPLKAIDIGSFKIVPFELKHDVTNFGYLLVSMKTKEKLLYITDSYYCPYRFSGVTHMMVEANYDLEYLRQNHHDGVINGKLKNRIIQSHMSIDTLLQMLKANDLSKLQQIYLIHLSENNSKADEFREQVQKETGVSVTVC